MRRPESLIEGREVPVAVAAMKRKWFIASLVDEASIDELRHQVSGCLAILNLILKLINPVFKIVDWGKLLGLFSVLLFFFFLFGFDLCFSSSPLRTYFQHLGTDAFALCIEYEKLELNYE